MKRWLMAAVLLVLVAASGCTARASGPAVSFLVSVAGATYTAPPGATLAVRGWSPEVTVRFSRPVPPDAVRVQTAGERWQVEPVPDRSDSRRYVFRLRCDRAGCPPVVATVTAPGLAAPATLTLSAATPPLLDPDRSELTALAGRVWSMATRGDAAGLLAMLAPVEQLTMPGGEFVADGAPPGLAGILDWAASRSGAPVLSATVLERRPYAYMDAVILHTSSGDFAVYVTIPERKLVKLFGAPVFDAP